MLVLLIAIACCWLVGAAVGSSCYACFFILPIVVFSRWSLLFVVGECLLLVVVCGGRRWLFLLVVC